MKKLVIIIIISFSIVHLNAATITVNNTSDSGTGSLREAINTANFGDKVKISPSLLGNGNDTIFLKSTISITKGIFIEGTFNSTDTIFISGSDTIQLFYVQTPHNATYSDCYLDSLALIHGKGIYGGAINIDWRSNTSTGNFIIRNCFFANNQATFGGAIASDATNSTSGGILEQDHTELHIFSSIFKNNIASKDGGAIYINLDDKELKGLSADFELENSVIINNASGNSGGGIFIYCDNRYSGFTTPTGASTVDVKITRSSICKNSAAKNGGGIYVLCDGSYNDDWGDINFDVTYSTLTDNTAVGSGGAIYCNSRDISDVDVGYCTITHNKAYNAGGSIYNISKDDRAYLKLRTNIIALNTNAAGVNNNVSNTGPNNGSKNEIESRGRNIFDDLTMSYYLPPTWPRDFIGETNTTINLEPLLVNDSGTYTRVPGINSVAIDAGGTGGLSPQNRPLNGDRDIGAAESLHCLYFTKSIHTTICSGDSIELNGNFLKTAGTYTDTAINNAGCDTITILTLKVNEMVTPSITITSSLDNILYSTSITIFTATTINAGPLPSYQWKKNGLTVGSNSATYSPGVLKEKDHIECILSSNLTCVTNQMATSNPITISIIDNNDEPCNAIAVPVKSTCNFSYYSNTDASNSPGVAAHNCANNTGNDVWFKFKSPKSGNIEIQTLSGTLTDAVMSLYTGTCSNLFEVGCTDDVGVIKMPSAILSGAKQDSTYFLRISGTSSMKGTFAICLFDKDSATSTKELPKNILSVYPNPSNGQFTIDFTKPMHNIQINVFNVYGNLVYSQMNLIGKKVDLTGFAKGCYFLEIISKDKKYSTSVVIQ